MAKSGTVSGAGHGLGVWRLNQRVQGYGLTETNAYVCSIAGQDYVERVSLLGILTPGVILMSSPPARESCDL